MKTLTPKIIVIGVIALVALIVSATPFPLVSVSINNATNTVTGVPAFSYNPLVQTITWTHGPLTNLTSFGMNLYANAPNSLATNNRVFLGTVYPFTTNAATETISLANYTVTNFLSMDFFSTNPVVYSGSYGN